MTTDTNIVSMIEAGIVLACSLAWSNMIQLAVKEIYPHSDNAILISQAIYTVLLTTIAMIIIYQLQNVRSHFY